MIDSTTISSCFEFEFERGGLDKTLFFLTDANLFFSRFLILDKYLKLSRVRTLSVNWSFEFFGGKKVYLLI